MFLGPEGARAIGEVLQQNNALKTIYIGCNGIGDAGAHYLADVIIWKEEFTF